MTRRNINTAVALAAVLVAANLIGGIVAEMANIATAIFATLFVAAKFSSRVARVLSMNVGAAGMPTTTNQSGIGGRTNALTPTAGMFNMFQSPGGLADGGNRDGMNLYDEWR